MTNGARMHGGPRHSSVLDQLGASIATGARSPGTVLTLAALGAEFGTSRSLVREVVRVLESMGMVESRRRVGITVRPPGDWNPFDPRLIRWRLDGPERDAQLLSLTELRAAIEPVAARLAAARAGEADRRRLVELAARLRDLGEAGRGADPEYQEADIAYHTLLLAASGNPMLAALADVVAEVLRGRTALGLMPPVPAPDALENHEAAAAAVAGRDGAVAEERARAVVAEVLGEVDSAAAGSAGAEARDGMVRGPAGSPGWEDPPAGEGPSREGEGRAPAHGGDPGPE